MQRSTTYYLREIARQVWTHPANQGARTRALLRSGAWQVWKRTVRRPRDTTFFGYRLRCHPDSNSASNVMYFTERFDPQEMDFLHRCLTPGDGFVDVGANIGTYSLLARSIVGPDGRVDAFEADRVAASRFRENVELNDLHNVTLHEVAVAAEDGELEFLTGFDVSNSIVTERDRDEATRTVRATTLDAALAGHSYAIGKIDVEGFEVAAFAGAAERLAAADPPVWLVEVIPPQLIKAGASPEELLAIFDRHDFVLCGFDGDDGRPTPLTDSERAALFGNVLAIHRSALDRLRS